MDRTVDQDFKGEADGAWTSLPLCRAYSVTFAGRLPVLIAQDGCGRPGSIWWMLGWMSTGETEALGAWSGRHDSSPDWAAVLADLEVRGVQQVGLACTATDSLIPECVPPGIRVDAYVERVDDWQGSRLAQPKASRRTADRDWRRNVVCAENYEEAISALAVAAQSPWASRHQELIDERRYALERLRQLWTRPPALRRELLSGDGTVAAVSQSLRRSVARHGPFSDHESALAFVRQALERSIRRISLRADAAVTVHNHHRVGFSPRMAALGV
jgi:putative transposase